MGKLASVLAIVLLAGLPAGALWPLPRGLQTGSKALKLSPDFSITTSFHGAPSDLQSAITRTKQQLKSDKLGRLVVGRGSNDEQAVRSAKTIKSLILELSGHATANSIASEAQKALEDRDEAYTLNVPVDGSSAVVTANTTLGIFRGLTTFTQLWYQVNEDTYTIEAPITIKDSPAYVRDVSTRVFYIELINHFSHTAGSCWILREISTSIFFLLLNTECCILIVTAFQLRTSRGQLMQ